MNRAPGSFSLSAWNAERRAAAVRARSSCPSNGWNCRGATLLHTCLRLRLCCMSPSHGGRNKSARLGRPRPCHHLIPISQGGVLCSTLARAFVSAHLRLLALKVGNVLLHGNFAMLMHSHPLALLRSHSHFQAHSHLWQLPLSHFASHHSVELNFDPNAFCCPSCIGTSRQLSQCRWRSSSWHPGLVRSSTRAPRGSLPRRRPRSGAILAGHASADVSPPPRHRAPADGRCRPEELDVRWSPAVVCARLEECPRGLLQTRHCQCHRSSQLGSRIGVSSATATSPSLAMTSGVN